LPRLALTKPWYRVLTNSWYQGTTIVIADSASERRLMPLLKRPAPVIPKRQYHVRIREPLALKLERYAEFLGAANTDHVIGEALDFVFRKDTDFNTWLAENPEGSLSVGTKP
jgi:hypothetical protein